MEIVFCKIKKILMVSLSIFVLGLIITPKVQAGYVVQAKKITLNKTSITLYVGKSETLKATVTPSAATWLESPTWSSSKKTVAAVNKDGKVTAKGAGTATITAKIDGKKATCKVTVKVAVTGIKLNAPNLKIAKGKTAKLTATITPGNASNKNVTWSSSNTNIATVNSNGQITAKKVGTTTITAKSAEKGYTAKCKVIVYREFIDIASELKKKIADGNVYYQRTTFSDFTKDNPVKRGKVDCSSYVSWVIYNYGKTNNIDTYKNAFKASKDTLQMSTWFNNNTGYVKKIGNLNNVINQLKAGDILLDHDSHVEIFAYKSNGRLYVYNCGSKSSVNNPSSGIGVTDTNRSSYIVYRLTK